jgi:hypothetical protein
MLTALFKRATLLQNLLGHLASGIFRISHKLGVLGNQLAVLPRWAFGLTSVKKKLATTSELAVG